MGIILNSKNSCTFKNHQDDAKTRLHSPKSNQMRMIIKNLLLGGLFNQPNHQLGV